MNDAVLAADGHEDGNERVPTRLRCDTSTCYLVWEVVDSDEDGVCDADEIVAGTDPFYSLSRPTIKEMVDLASTAMLPSFEAGLGVFVVLPPELQAIAQASRGISDESAAFPLGLSRAWGLAAFGISSDLMNQYGINPEKQGLTVGLTLGTQDSAPVPLVGRTDWSLIAADGGSSDGGSPNGGKHDTHGYLHRDKVSTKNNLYHEDGCHTMIDGDGNWVTRNGNKEEVDSGKGKPDGGTKYVNPDADPDYGSDGPIKATPTAGEYAYFRRMRGAVILTVDNPDQPSLSPDAIETPYTTVILTDGENYLPFGVLMPGWDTGKPPVTEAQPETRPDLPSPEVPAGASPTPPSGEEDGGSVDCSWGQKC